jgi:hypothetical protein
LAAYALAPAIAEMAYYGVNAFPQDWIEQLALRELINEKATALFDFSNA